MIRIGRPSSYLGLAVSDRGIACAEVGSGPIQRTAPRSVRRAATFEFTAEHSLEHSAATGQALASFLREHRFSATHAVIGVPARWLIAAEKDVPPIPADQAKAMLRIQAERQSNGETGEMTFDFAGETSASSASRVLLVGISKQRLQRVQDLIDAAGLSILAITSTGLALAGSVNQSDREAGAMLLLQAGGGEMIVRQNGAVKMLRHVSLASNGHGTPAIAPLGAELRRTMVLGASGNGDRELILMNGVGLAREQLTELSDRAGVPVRTADEIKLLNLSREGALAAGADASSSSYAFPAISLALTAARPGALPLDFAHSKLAPPPVKRFSKPAMYGIVAGAALILGLGALYFTVSSRQSELDAINAQLDKDKPTLTSAHQIVDRASFADGYFKARPAMLECLRQLSLTFHDNDRIWVDTLTIHDNGKGTLAGKSDNQQTVLELVERLKQNKKFSDVSRLDVHEADQRTHEWTYSLNFTFNLTAE